MDVDTRLALTGLQCHWHGIYEIGASPDGKRWTATRIDTPGVILTGGSCGDLRVQLENDHAERKPRNVRYLADGASL
jgi:hypothetical protein